jgi:capsular polysaccharide biosynthesis protein
MKLLLGIGLTVVLLISIIVIKHTLYTAIRRQEQQKSEEPS